MILEDDDEEQQRIRSKPKSERRILFSIALFMTVSGVLVWFYGNEQRIRHIFTTTTTYEQDQFGFFNNYSHNVTITTTTVEVAVPPPPPHKVILFWVPFFSSLDYGFGFGRKPFLDSKCPVPWCETTSDRSRLAESDAILFHIRDVSVNDLPKSRQPHQRWTFFLMESPDNTNFDLRKLNNVFNWTATYRLDSDLFVPYYLVRPRRPNGTTGTSSVTTTTTTNKSHLVSWLVSHCHTHGHREQYVAELNKYIPVDTYGACGKPCPRNSPCSTKVFSDYKFYLSFENSICTDYVTEKFSNALRRNIVPVVYGGANYTKVAPPDSFIDVRDFRSPQHLAQYLLELDKNDTAYDEYFKWQANYQVQNGIVMKQMFCDMCAKLHQDDEPSKVYSNIHDWWKVQGKCTYNRL